MSENSNESPDSSAPKPTDGSPVAPKAPESGKPLAPKINLGAGQSKPPIKSGTVTSPPSPPSNSKAFTPITAAQTTRKPLNITKPPIGSKETTKFSATKSPFVTSKPGNTKFSVTQSPFAQKGKPVGSDKSTTFTQSSAPTGSRPEPVAAPPAAAPADSQGSNVLLIALGALVAIGSIAVAAVMYIEVSPYL